MRVSVLKSLLLGSAQLAAAASWGFDAATVSVVSKGAGIGNGLKDKLSDHAPLTKPITLSTTDTLKIVLTATSDSKPARPHQAFLLLRDQTTGLEATLPLSTKESGRAQLTLTHKELPVNLLTATSPLRATLLLGSFGTTTPFSNHVFNLAIALDPNAPPPSYTAPERYGQKPEIHHVFKTAPTNPPRLISVVFVLAVLACVPALLGAWLYLGANARHISKALGTAPVAHALFFGSILAMEALFFAYYVRLTLFELLPLAGGVGLVAYLSGSKALSEVQLRRLAGDR